MAFDPGNRLIVALDVPGRAEADALAARLEQGAGAGAGAAGPASGAGPGLLGGWLKVGLELFVAEGPELVRAYVARGHRIMLDLKLHDIPATVGRATAQAAALGAGLITVHADGGRAMLRAAVDAARAQAGQAGQARERARILAVTVLTSMDDADAAEVGMSGNVVALVVRRAVLAVDAGCDGVVASPHEAAWLRQLVPPDFLVVTPGVRPAGADAGDQKRVMTPGQARAAGADLVVCGRPIRDAADPAAAARAIAAELAAARPGA